MGVSECVEVVALPAWPTPSHDMDAETPTARAAPVDRLGSREHVAAAGDAAVFTAPNGEPLISSEIVVEVSLAGLYFKLACAIPPALSG